MTEFLAAFAVALGPEALLLIFIGCSIALVLGMLPGLSSTEAMIILLPFTFTLDLSQSIILLSAAYASAFVGGALTSIVFGIPGSSTGLVTVLDGHPFHKQGRTIYAVTIAALASAGGGLLGLALVVVLMPVMEPISLMFGPPEWFAFVIFGLVILAFSDNERFVKGLIAGALGLLAGTIGMSVITSEPRFTMGVQGLWSGIPIIAAFVGLYPLTEALSMMLRDEKRDWAVDASKRKSWADERREIREGATDCARHGDKVALGGVTGWIIGVIPGVGATLANLIGYLVVKEVTRDKSRFGKGEVKGLIGAEASNNASVGGALVPALALGIPGSINTAILLGVFLINGIQPGTNVFAENIDLTWLILISVAMATVLASALVIAGGWRLISLVTMLRAEHIAPIVIVVGLCAVLFARGNPLDLVVAGVLGILGLLMKQYGFSRIAFVIALMLGPLVESAFFQSLSIGRGDYSIFINSPVSMVLWGLVAACIGTNFVRTIIRFTKRGLS